MEDVDIDELITSLQQRVAERRRAGDYPPGLEEQLEAEFDQIMKAVHRHELDTGELHRRLTVVAQAAANVTAEPPLDSRLPGGGTVHAAAARVVRRHTATLADTVRGLGNEVTNALLEVQRLFEAQRSADERQLDEVIASMLDRLAVLDHVADAVVLLEQRVAALEADHRS